jgi:erythromycin esterase-like protein/predicted phosphoribosyltransferase
MTDRLFRDRRDAGRSLAGPLDSYRGRSDVVVLALPRGGVPVGYEVASALRVPLDVVPVGKLAVPGHEDLAMGAIASGGVVVLNEDVVRGLRIPPSDVERVADREGRELSRRERAYREGRPGVDPGGMKVILVDDGLAAGAGLRAAVLAVRRLDPARVVVALPAAAESTYQELDEMVDEVVCATTPSPFLAVGASYWDFEPTGDDQVRDLLRDAATPVRPARQRGADADLAALRSEALPARHGVPSRDALFDVVGDARFVLIGESTHGTHDFYAARAVMTRHLIEKRGFCAVAVEGDWPDALRVNRYVHGRPGDATPEQALRGFERFPAWMWRNDVVLDFVGWLRDHNDRYAMTPTRKAGFYGLDVFGLHRSMREVVAYLERVDPAAAERARHRYAGFDHASDDEPQAHGLAAGFGAGDAREQEITDQLVDRRRQALAYTPGAGDADDLFHADQSARLVKASAEYYRSLFGGRVPSWNLRDQHMADTLEALADQLGRRRRRPAKIVVWAHNAHVGDVGSTELATQDEVTLGQLLRDRYPDQCRLIGFTTSTGTVTAADEWGGPAQRKWVRPPLPDSVERMLHQVGGRAFLLKLRDTTPARETLRSARLERAIGVVYRPRTERPSHYFRARLGDQFDAVIHIDETRALEPLDRGADWERGEFPETYPYAG